MKDILEYPEHDASEDDDIANMTPEEEKANLEEFTKYQMSKEENEQWLTDMILSHRAMGYIDENGHPHIANYLR